MQPTAVPGWKVFAFCAVRGSVYGTGGGTGLAVGIMSFEVSDPDSLAGALTVGSLIGAIAGAAASILFGVVAAVAANRASEQPDGGAKGFARTTLAFGLAIGAIGGFLALKWIGGPIQMLSAATGALIGWRGSVLVTRYYRRALALPAGTPIPVLRMPPEVVAETA